MGIVENNNKKPRKWKGFRRYLYKIIASNVLLVLIPIGILGAFWFSMIKTQSTKNFYQQKSIEFNEIISGINQRVKAIQLEVATEVQDRKYSSYTFSNDYISDLYMISNRLTAMMKKYSLIDSVYFYDKTTGRIYSSKSNKDTFFAFYDTEWIRDVDEKNYSVQLLPLRYTINNEESPHKSSPITSSYNTLVFSLAIKGRPDFYFITNVSVSKLYDEIADSYHLDNPQQEFFFLDSSGMVLDGQCSYIKPQELLPLAAQTTDSGTGYTVLNKRIYFLNSFDCGITGVISYPTFDSLQEARYWGKYILLICLCLVFFLLIISLYMAKRLYQPIDTLYSEISENTGHIQNHNISSEIDMLQQAFTEMNTFNSNAKLKLTQFEELNKAFNFRNFLENSQGKNDFMKNHSNLFQPDGSCLCELMILKVNVSDSMFLLNLQEILRTYLKSSLKGIITRIEDDSLVLLYSEPTWECIGHTRNILTDTVNKLTDENAYFAVSQTISHIDELIPQFHICCNLIKNAYFFNWKNEAITSGSVETVKDIEDIYMKLLNINTSFIRCIVSQNEAELTKQFMELEDNLRKIKNASQVKDVYNRILVELDHEFHFTKFLETNLLHAIYEKKTLTDLLLYGKQLLMNISHQYGNNDAKEFNYCNQAKQFLDEHYMNDMNITDTADYLDISYSYLSKIFREHTGMTLTDYLNNVRIEKSKDYLTTTFLTLTEIANKVGYNNVQSYQRFFKKYVNLTPGDYRKINSKPELPRKNGQSQ